MDSMLKNEVPPDFPQSLVGGGAVAVYLGVYGVRFMSGDVFLNLLYNDDQWSLRM